MLSGVSFGRWEDCMKGYIQERFRLEREKLKGMERKRAFHYLWDYYKGLAIGILVAIGIVVYMIALLLRPEVDVKLGVMFVNFPVDVSQDSSFAQGFYAFAGVKKPETIVFDNNAFFNLAKSSDYANSYFQKTVAYLEGGDIDAVICQYDNLVGIASGGRFMDLRNKSMEKIYETYQDRIVEIEKDGKTIPVGIDVSDSPVLKRLGGFDEGESCYVGISSFTVHGDMIGNFLEYILPPEG